MWDFGMTAKVLTLGYVGATWHYTQQQGERERKREK